jgi:hypothetical protein
LVQHAIVCFEMIRFMAEAVVSFFELDINPSNPRIGFAFQARLPEPGEVSADRGEKRVCGWDGVSRKRHRSCGKPGCTLQDMHNGPHSNDICTIKRRACMITLDRVNTQVLCPRRVEDECCASVTQLALSSDSSDHK